MTQSQAPDATGGPKLLAASSIKLRVAVASGIILGAGALLAPRAVPTALSAPQERAAPLLEEQVQLREIVRPFRGVQDVAIRVREHGVAIPFSQQQTTRTVNDFSEASRRSQVAAFGVFVSDNYVLTHAVALDGRTSVQVSTAAGRMLNARVAEYEPSTGLVLLQTEPSGALPVTLASGSPDPGTLAVAVARWDGRDIAVPVFITRVESDRYAVGAIDDSVLLGMPVYNLDGELLAIAVNNGSEGWAFPAPEAANRLIARASAGEQRRSFGISFQNLSSDLTSAFGDRGVLVSNVVSGGPADVAGIQVGDVLLAVGDVEVDSADTATRSLSSVDVRTATTLRVLQRGRIRAVEVTPAFAYEVAALARVSADESPSGTEARVLFPAPLLDRAGIPSTARVLSVNGRLVSSRAQAQRELRRSNVILLLHHDGERFFAGLERSR